MPKKQNPTTAPEATSQTATATDVATTEAGATTTETPTADPVTETAAKPNVKAGTQLDPKTGRIMSPEQKIKAAEKAAKEQKKKDDKAAKEQAKKEKVEAKAAKAAETEAQKAERLAVKEAEKTAKKAIGDAIKAEAGALGLKFAEVRKFIEGNQLTLAADGALVISDAAGNNPMTMSAYIDKFADDEVKETLKKAGRSRGPGKPREPRVHPSSLGVVVSTREATALPIETGQPWSAMVIPTVLTVNVQDAQIAATVKTVGEGDDAKQIVDSYWLNAGDQTFAAFNREGFRDLGWYVNYKIDFLDKLATNPALACGVVNHLLKRHRPQLFGFAKDHTEQIMDSFPGHRSPLSHAEAAQATVNAVKELTGGASAMECVQLDKGFFCRVAGGQVYPLDDGTSVRVGVEVFHRYGIDLAIRLCLFDQDKHALVSNDTVYMWTGGESITVEAQLKFIQESVPKVLDAAGACIARMNGMTKSTVTAAKAEAMVKDTNMEKAAVKTMVSGWATSDVKTMTQLELLRFASAAALTMDVTDRRIAQRTLGEWAAEDGAKMKRLAERGSRVVQGY